MPNSALHQAPSPPIKKEVYNNSINPSFGNAPKKTIQDYNNTQTKEYSPAPIEPQKQGQTFSESLKENQDRINPIPQREYSNENMATIYAGEIINPNEPLYNEMVTNNPEVLKAEQKLNRAKDFISKLYVGNAEGKTNRRLEEAKAKYERVKSNAYNAYISKKNEDNSQGGTQGNGQRKEHIQSPSYDRVEVDGEIKYVPKGSAFDTDANNATEWNSRVARNVENKEISAENTRQEFETTLADDSLPLEEKEERIALGNSIAYNQSQRLEQLYNSGKISVIAKNEFQNKLDKSSKQLFHNVEYSVKDAFTKDRMGMI